MSNKNTTGINVGGSSILVIFILLCLTTFATLSMVSAKADLRLTEKTVAAAAQYYAADAAAEEQLARIDGALRAQPWAADSAAALMAALPTLQVESAEGALLASYAVPVNDSQELAVELRISPTVSGEQQITRTAWAVRNTGEWNPAEEGIDLWDGGDFLLGDGMPPLETQ